MTTPLLSGTLADRAFDSLDAISSRYGRLSPRRVPGPSLIEGHVGVALLHDALEPLFPGRGHAHAREAMLDAAAAAIARDPTAATLYTGFVGVAWAHDHLRRRARARDADPNVDLDGVLLDLLRPCRTWEGHFDVVKGLVGIGVYALGRRSTPTGGELLDEVLRLLAGLAEPRRSGTVWCVEGRLLPPRIRERRPRRYVDLGLAHGTPGVAALLAHVVAAGAGGPRARALLRDSVRWLLAQELTPSAPSRFPFSVGRGVERLPARTAWCYGDLGVAWVLVLAARALCEPEWEHHALRIASAAASRPFDHTGVVDTGLCHGAAGVAHMFHRLHRATGAPAMRTAARAWFERLFDMRWAKGGLAGYWTQIVGDPEPTSEVGLLTGAAGVGLALAAAVSTRAPRWDVALLLGEPAASRAQLTARHGGRAAARDASGVERRPRARAARGR